MTICTLTCHTEDGTLDITTSSTASTTTAARRWPHDGSELLQRLALLNVGHRLRRWPNSLPSKEASPL